MSFKANISEVFMSPQGEGEYVGFRQVFLRFAGCPFDCPYCDTNKNAESFFELNGNKFPNPITCEEFTDLLIEAYGDGSNFHSYSFTGGEPLVNNDFVYECAGLLKKKSKAKLFLETSGLLVDPIKRADGIFDILSIDIKTHSFKTIKNIPYLFAALKSLQSSEWYLKLLLDEKQYDNNIMEEVLENLQKFQINKLILQPVDNVITHDTVSKVLDMFYSNAIEARVIPQTHKMLSLR